MFLKILVFLISFFPLLISSANAAGKISLSCGEEEYNLGALQEGQIYNRSFIISNEGDSELAIKKISASCGCTTIVFPKKQARLPPSASIEVKFIFNTSGMEGAVKRHIYIASNDPGSPSLDLKLITDVKRFAADTKKRFLSLGALTVIGAGLIDGINPCAFTVLVFFISFLSFVGYKRKELLVLGTAFITAVFVTYILLGVGLFKAIRTLEPFLLLSDIIYLVVAYLAFILGAYSVYDWYIYKKTNDTEKIKLRLPDFIKNKIHKIIQDSSRDKNRALIDLVVAVLISGFLVSLLESVCTGQTYLPTVVYVLKDPDLRPKALVYLLLYNFMFILPLVIVFLAALVGVKSESFSKLSRKYLGLVKLLTAALFFGLGILLILIKGR